MRLFLDSVRLCEIEAAVARRCVAGVTTNPTFLRREAGGRPLRHLRRIVELLRPVGLPLCVQVMSVDPREMLAQAEVLGRELDYGGLVVKVPCGWNELPVIAELARRGVAVNGTACMTAMQTVMAAASGARYATLFCGKMSDIGIDPAPVVEESSRALRAAGGGCELVAASIRRAFDVHECLRRGADVVTVVFSHLPALCDHPKTSEAVRAFAESFVPLDVVGARPREAGAPSRPAATRRPPAARRGA